LPLPTLAEESLNKALENGCQFFGPRFSLGLLLNDVETAHTNGIKVISWTLNSQPLISDYLQNGKFDGFITDYPAYAVYDFYTMF
jgi:glycerophosphoryl diester phosphodiesterase